MRQFAAVMGVVAMGAAPPPSNDAKLKAIIAPVSGTQMKATVEKLVSFGTRHTLSSQTDPKRGIGAALEWTRGEFQRYSDACGNCLTIVDPAETFTNDAHPEADAGARHGRDPARDRAAQRRRDYHRPYRQPGLGSAQRDV